MSKNFNALTNCFTLVIVIFAVSTTLHAANQPNIILIMADDLSAKDMGCYGNETLSTPTLSRLAQDGVSFKTCWATPICSPSRAQIMTGRYGTRTHWFHNDLKNQASLASRQLTIGSVLKKAGYATTVVGKWQLPGAPKDHGFDDEYMWLGGHGLWRKLKSQFDGPVEGKELKGLRGTLPGRPARYWHPAIAHNGTLLKTKKSDYGPELFVDYINDFIEQKKNEPFFIYFPMCLPHQSWDFERNIAGYLPTPLLDEAGKRIPGQSEPSLKANVFYIDHMVDGIIKQLDRLGIRENTLLIFTSDNGTVGYGKGNTRVERGPRVPLVIDGPGLLKIKGSRDELIQFCDFLPTLADLAGARIPEENPLDGKSFAPLLKGEKYQEHEWIFSYYRTSRFLRNKRYLLDGRNQLWDCGEQRNEKGYLNVTDSREEDVIRVKEKFGAILSTLPAPHPDDPETGYLFNAPKEQKFIPKSVK